MDNRRLKNHERVALGIGLVGMRTPEAKARFAATMRAKREAAILERPEAIEQRQRTALADQFGAIIAKWEARGVA